MVIRFSKKFKKQYQKLPQKIQQQTRRRIELWQEDPTNSLLRVHRLEGKLTGYYSINITSDIRALFEIVDKEIYLYDMIGSDSQLYS